jgi:hypothetical protein
MGFLEGMAGDLAILLKFFGLELPGHLSCGPFGGMEE